MANTLDTLEIVKRLKDAGFNEAQAEAVTTIFRDVREADFAQLATKADLEKLQLTTRTDLREMEQRLTIRFGSMIVVATGLLLAARFLS
jgi:Protein of unknown function (DUF1640)